MYFIDLLYLLHIVYLLNQALYLKSFNDTNRYIITSISLGILFHAIFCY